ncbi:MAG: divergent PAP2 family protein [Thermaerobacter sp.]|nr:divergent PAP2 family protein [Thermaerobacter sp.]
MHALFHALAFFLHELANENRMLITAATAMAAAQVIKFVVSSVRSRTILSERLFSSGGMPSAHSAMVTALATAVGNTHGWHSDLFAVIAVFSIIVLYDAVNIRYAVGQQARFLNSFIGHTEDPEFKEQLGHTPQEVVAGAVLGVIVALLYYI